MSCYSFVEQYAIETEANKKEIIIKEAIDCLQKDDEQHTHELYEFIDDFINSQEYLDYIGAKKEIMKRCVSTQCYENDIYVELKQENFVEKYPLTEEQKKMYAFKEQFEKYAEKQSKLDEIKKQERGIEIIKEKIEGARIYWQCTKEWRQRKKEKKDETLLQLYSSKLGIDLSELSPKSLATVLGRIKTNYHILCTRKERKKKNILKILEKLLFEERIKKEVIKLQNKTFDYKVKRKEKVIDDMEVIGTKIELINRDKKDEITEEPDIAIEHQIQIEQVVNDKKKKRKEKAEKEKKQRKEKKGKNVKDKRPRKERKEKVKKKDKGDAKLVLPIIPIISPRERIAISDNFDQALDLVEEFRNFDNEMENRDMFQNRNKNYILGDTGIKSKPNRIIFQNYEEERTYRKTIVLSNVSSQPRKLRFVKFVFQDQYDELVFEVENFGIQKLFTGCQVKFWLSFHPYDSLRSYEGKMLFLSYDIRRCEYYQMELEIECLPKYSHLCIYPDSLNFGQIPIWKAKDGQHFKILKIQNRAAKPCTVYIHKMADPLDIESIFDDENKENIAPAPQHSLTSMDENIQCIRDIISQCIDNIDNNFFFEESFLNLKEYEERKIRIFFKNAVFTGNYFEKFTFDIYEQFRNGDVEAVGCKEMSLFAETTGHFLSVNPIILDFGVCQLNSCYQLNFEICNDSKNTHAVSVRIPKHIADSVQCNISTVYLPPQGKRVVWLKFIPRSYILTESSTYFDKGTSILEFSIHLYIISKNYHDYPPIKVIVYAIISNTDDITIIASPGCSLNNFLDTILLDMGSCSIYETIWTDIYLQNNTTVTQICGFVDLPQCITLVPNFGFVKLYPNQTKKFTLYLSPEITDFPSFSIGSLRNNKYFFKLSIDTISNIGKLKKELYSKKLRSSLDMMLKELTKKDSQELLQNMLGLMSELKSSSTEEISHSMVNRGRMMYSTEVLKGSANENTAKSFDDTVLNYENFVIVDTNSRKEIWCKVSLKRPLLEFSHQTVEFPDTPCGSYSVMEIELRALEKEIKLNCAFMNKKQYKHHLDFMANFRITGSSEEISIQPRCGVLSSGESIKITLIATPNVPQEIVDQTAKSIKYSEIYEMKLKEFQALRTRRGKEKEGKKKGNSKNKKEGKSKDSGSTKEFKSKKTISKKTKNGKKKNKEDKGVTTIENDVPDIVIADKELEYDYLDLFPAEMVCWRNMTPYYVQATFTCYIDYTHEHTLHKKTHKLYLDAICKVIRPDFTSNLKLQRLDFGKCIVGMTISKEIMIQNITYENINLKTTLLSPVGSFFLPLSKDIVIPPEHTLKLPIAFKPVSTDKTL